MSKVINSTEADFETSVLNSEKPVLVDFWAPWCGPCRMMGPVLDDLSDELKDKIGVVKVNVDDPQNMGLAMRYGIRSIPNMKLFKNGNVVKEVIGMLGKEQLFSEIKEHIS